MQNYKRAVLATGILLAALMTSEAALADCSPLKLVTSIPLTPVADGRGELAPVKIGGQDYRMTVDTGSSMTAISGKAADDLKLVRHTGNFEFIDLSGDQSSQYVQSSFQLGTLKSDTAAFVILPNMNMSAEGSAGLLGADVLRRFDVSIDFGADKMDLLSQDHCEGKVIYWPASAVAVVPMRVTHSGGIVFPVLVDGREVYAQLDTGASNSTINLDTAESNFGLKMGSDDTKESGDLLGSKGLHTYLHTFKSIDFSGLAVSNPKVYIIPNMMRDTFENRPETGSHIPDASKAENKAEMLIGMNILRHLHIYIAYKEEKLYITPAGTAGASASAPVSDSVPVSSAK